MPRSLRCPACQALQPASVLQSPAFHPCPGCGTPLMTEAFPAFLAPPEATAPGSAAESAESSCFFHPHKRAVHACDSCGRFLCPLCEVPSPGGHLCPDCLVGRKEKGDPSLTDRRVRHDHITFYLSFLPAFLVFPTIVTAPAALAYGIAHWKAPPSLVTPGRSRMVLSLLFALLQVAAWVLVLARAVT